MAKLFGYSLTSFHRCKNGEGVVHCELHVTMQFIVSVDGGFSRKDSCKALTKKASLYFLALPFSSPERY